ncbi:MAG: hypothetical protein DCC75_13770 [Proteobacteria bacterium]|nr:MAG: hypothetical protein DCC75_13770 [Pseudomonadota bacterium]
MNKLFFGNILPGTLLFSRYELVKCLSAADLGGVYLCRDLDHAGRKIALKILFTPDLKDSGSHELFKREIELALSIEHPNVVKGLEVIHDDDFTAYTMEYVEGGTLADYLHENTCLGLQGILSIMSQVAAGLKAIHKAGIIHRDLKPENILVNKDGRIKITDFGIAMMQCDSTAREQGHMVGTVNYLSPEYIRDGVFDERSDIYAFGVIAYELITGQLPFSGTSLIDSLTSRVRFDPVSPRQLRTDIPRALSDLAMKAMKRNPALRYQKVQDIVRHLEMVESLGKSLLEEQASQRSIREWVAITSKEQSTDTIAA